jgi:Transcriptional regulator PadR-like family
MKGRHGPHRHHKLESRHSSRAFDYGELRLLVLEMIGEQPRRGYELMRAIEQRMGGSYCPSPGVIYPTHSPGSAEKAGLADYIDFMVGDAVQMIEDLQTGVDSVLVDLWKYLYLPCLKALHPKLNAGAILVAGQHHSRP